MKIAPSLSPCESETLFQLSINHPWRDARLRAAAFLMLSKGERPTAQRPVWLIKLATSNAQLT
jgi:hypothetical protein